MFFTSEIQIFYFLLVMKMSGLIIFTCENDKYHFLLVIKTKEFSKNTSEIQKNEFRWYFFVSNTSSAPVNTHNLRFHW